MCGLVGIAGKLAFKDELTMKRLLLLDYFRGPDSTGLAGIRSDGNAIVAKIPSNPLDLFDMGRFKEALNGYKSTAFIGHNRSATRGAVNHGNSHPFQFDHIVGAHNGTLDHSSAKALEDKVGEKFPVDSAAIFACIAAFGIEETAPLLQGAWSLVWFDLKANTLNFLRNKERPLWYGYNKEFDHLFWASEWPMIDAAIKLAGTASYEFYQEEDTGFRFWATEENVHYTFDIDELKAGSKTRPKPLAKECKGKEPAPVVATTGHDPFMRGGSGSTYFTPRPTTSSTLPSTHSKTTSHGSKTIIHLTGSPENPLAGYFGEQHFNSMVKGGCAWCKKPIEWGDKGLLIFEKDDIVQCAECSVGGGAGDPTRIYVKNFDQLM